MHFHTCTHTHIYRDNCRYGVAMISRLLSIIGLFANYRLFYRALLQKRPMILRSLLIVATPYSQHACMLVNKYVCLCACVCVFALRYNSYGTVSYVCVHIYINTYVRIYIYIYILKYTCIYIYMCVYIYIYIYVYIYACWYIHVHMSQLRKKLPYAHTVIDTHVCRFTYTHTNISKHTYVHTHSYVCVYINTHTRSMEINVCACVHAP